MTLPIVPEVWRGDTCGSNGRVQVKCTKINGKCFFENFLQIHLTSTQSTYSKSITMSGSEYLGTTLGSNKKVVPRYSDPLLKMLLNIKRSCQFN